MRVLLLLGGALVALALAVPARMAPAAGGRGTHDPLPGAVETQAFGCTTFELEPVSAACSTGHFHSGLDLAAPAGTPVRAAETGVAHIIDSGGAGYGLHVLLEHTTRLSTLYGHLSSASIGEGSTVTAGAELGRVGSSGFSTGPHLHFEVRRDGRPVDPRAWLPAGTNEGGFPW